MPLLKATIEEVAFAVAPNCVEISGKGYTLPLALMLWQPNTPTLHVKALVPPVQLLKPAPFSWVPSVVDPKTAKLVVVALVVVEFVT